MVIIQYKYADINGFENGNLLGFGVPLSTECTLGKTGLACSLDLGSRPLAHSGPGYRVGGHRLTVHYLGFSFFSEITSKTQSMKSKNFYALYGTNPFIIIVLLKDKAIYD